MFSAIKKGNYIAGLRQPCYRHSEGSGPPPTPSSRNNQPRGNKNLTAPKLGQAVGSGKDSKSRMSQEKMKAAAGEERRSSLLPIPTGMVFLLKKENNFFIVFPPAPLPKGKRSGLGDLTPEFLHHHRPGCRKSLCVTDNTLNSEGPSLVPAECLSFPTKQGGQQ